MLPMCYPADHYDGNFIPNWAMWFVLELEEYISILELCLRNLPPEAVIHRLTGDGAKRDLLAPLWSGDKKRVLNAIHQAFLRDNLIQGSTL